MHVRRVAGGVPEDRWDALLAEVTRILKVGGAFEMIEDDLFFPGSIVVREDGEEEDEVETEDASSEGEREGVKVKEMCERQYLPLTLPCPLPSPRATDATLRESLMSEATLTLGDKDKDPTLAVVQLAPRALERSVLNLLPTQDEALPGSAGLGSSSAAPPSLPLQARGRTQAQGQAQVTTTSHNHDAPRTSVESWRALGRTVADVLSRTTVELEHDEDGMLEEGAGLYHAHAAPVVNPRDHSVLETAYNELHAARFINLAPLALLTLTLGSHFKSASGYSL